MAPLAPHDGTGDTSGTVVPRTVSTILEQAVQLHEEGTQACLAVVVARSGSAPQVPGAKSLFLRNGRILGTIGGGCLEAECRRLGLEAMATGKAVLREFRLDDDFGWDDGLICGGRVQVLLLPNAADYVPALRCALEQRNGLLKYDLRTGAVSFLPRSGVAEDAGRLALQRRREVLTEEAFFEPILPPERLVIFGAGHVGREIARLGRFLGFHVTVVDDRADLLTEEALPDCDERVNLLPERYAASLATDEDTYLCVVTRGHRNDARVLREVIRKPRAYLGMIGSRRKREVIRREMVGEGLCTAEEFDAVQSPMGLDIGAETVEEIAIAIAAELVRVRSSKRGPYLARCPKPKPKTRQAPEPNV